jgi:UDP-N-acetylglucosamine pyrophosphorylase
MQPSLDIESCDKSYREIPIYVSKGQTIGLRMIPTDERDLKFLLSEQPRLESNAEKVRESVHNSLINWAKSCGEGSEYRDNSPSQCLSPVGHWYEFSNLLLNGTLAKMLRDRPQLQTLMLHNIDKIGVDVNTNILGKFLESKSTLAYEVVPRRIDDMGGGLFRVNGKPRLVEILALPTDEDELKFSYYNSLTTWIDIDKLLTQFGLSRHDILESTEIIPQAINEYSKSPSYLCHH